MTFTPYLYEGESGQKSQTLNAIFGLFVIKILVAPDLQIAALLAGAAAGVFELGGMIQNCSPTNPSLPEFP